MRLCVCVSDRDTHARRSGSGKDCVIFLGVAATVVWVLVDKCNFSTALIERESDG